MNVASLGQYLSRLALVYWLGEMLFFVTIFAPRVFKVLPREMAGQLQGSIFPAYYTAGLIAAFVFFVGLGLRAWSQDPTLVSGGRLALLIGLAVFATLVFAYSRFSLTPELGALRPQIAASPEAAARFATLHTLSVRVNSAGMLALLVMLGSI